MADRLGIYTPVMMTRITKTYYGSDSSSTAPQEPAAVPKLYTEDHLADAYRQGAGATRAEDIRLARCVGRPVGAGDGGTYIPGSSADVVRALEAAPIPPHPRNRGRRTAMCEPLGQPIDTAPREFVEKCGPLADGWTLHFGRHIKVRGEFEGKMEEFIASWALGTVPPDHEMAKCTQEAAWIDEDGEPIDWPLTEWRELTDAERAQAEGVAE